MLLPPRAREFRFQASPSQEIKSAQVAFDRERERLRRINIPDFRDGAIPPNPVQARVVFRMEDSNFHQLGRLTDLLLKLKRTARQNAAPITKDEGTSHDVTENKGAIFASHDVDENK